MDGYTSQLNEGEEGKGEGREGRGKDVHFLGTSLGSDPDGFEKVSARSHVLCGRLAGVWEVVLLQTGSILGLQLCKLLCGRAVVEEETSQSF